MPLEFSIANQDLIKIAIAVLCGGLLGLERQYKNKTAGFRTIILICLAQLYLQWWPNIQARLQILTL
jgi:uncharacterized membrane protein YhiD involved in acid resistance